jgi:hypothetical protein
MRGEERCEWQCGGRLKSAASARMSLIRYLQHTHNAAVVGEKAVH